jgi:integrase
MRTQQVLTQRGVESAKPKAARYGKRDGVVPGLRLLVFPAGEKTFALFTRVNDRLVNFKIGSASTLTLAKARELARGKLEEIAGGEDPRTSRSQAADAEAETVTVVVERFIARHVKVKNRTAGEIERKLRVEVLPRWGRRRIASITQKDVIALLDSIVDRGAATQANRVLATLRKFFNWACERGTLDRSPCDRVKAPSAENKRDRVLDHSELALIWQGAERLGYPFGPYFQLLILTGQRREEVAGMRWGEINSALTLWTIPRERVKNNEPHAVPLVPWARSLLASLPRIGDSDFVFTSTGDASISGYSKAKAALDAEIAKLNGGEPIAPFVVLDLRRTAATNWAKLGVALPTVEKLLNHVSGVFGGVSGIYNRHDFADEKKQALECWAFHLAGILP